MIDGLSDNTQAILLLTAPLIVGKLMGGGGQLSAGEYNRLAVELHARGRKPADLLSPESDEILGTCAEVDRARIRTLLARGFQLSQAVERWSSRSIWVVSRADVSYPRRLRSRLRDLAPPVLYGIGHAPALDSGGLAIVGSRDASEALLHYTETTARGVAAARETVVSGGARGIDQVAMRAALEQGGRAVGVLADSLERAAIARENREFVMERRLVLVSPFDPSAGFNVGNAMQRNKLVYALADAALVVGSDYNKGGTWTGAVEQLEKLRLVRVYVRSAEDDTKGIRELLKRGAVAWPDPQDAAGIKDALAATPLGQREAPQEQLPFSTSSTNEVSGKSPIASDSFFGRVTPDVENNAELRLPQRAAYDAVKKHFAKKDAAREVGIVLPVGCGKSGLVAIVPFAITARRVLVIAPNLNIADQLFKAVDPASPKFFLGTRSVLKGPPWPEPAEIRGPTANHADLEAADVVVTNIQQLQGAENRWLDSMDDDFFDAILVDEAHHNVAVSWTTLRDKFKCARIINFSATPTRADGQVMAGTIIYSFPVIRAMELGFVKRLGAVVLNPKSLRYVRRDGDVEIEVSLDEVRRLGEEDSDFRRSIVTSKETLSTIVDCSIRELRGLRTETGEQRLKIIASALNYEHCIQICQAFTSRGMRAAYVHSKEEGAANARVHQKLENHELDVIVQVRKLGEGFDHPHLSVAAVCSVFSNLSPFVQFVGRVMRVLDSRKPDAPVNRGVVVFHAGANIAQRWKDFRDFSDADQAYFDDLLSTEYVDPDSTDTGSDQSEGPAPITGEMEIRAQGEITTETLHLWRDDPRAMAALEYLRSQGMTPEEFAEQSALLPVPETKQRQRRAAREALDPRIKTRVVAILKRRGINPEGKELDKLHLGKSNFVVIKALVDRRCSELVGRKARSRNEWTQVDFDKVDAHLDQILAAAEADLLDG